MGLGCRHSPPVSCHTSWQEIHQSTPAAPPDVRCPIPRGRSLGVLPRWTYIPSWENQLAKSPIFYLRIVFHTYARFTMGMDMDVCMCLFVCSTLKKPEAIHYRLSAKAHARTVGSSCIIRVRQQFCFRGTIYRFYSSHSLKELRFLPRQ